MLPHMLSVVLASCQATVSCGNRENFHSYLTPNCLLNWLDSGRHTIWCTVLGGLMRGVESMAERL